MTRRYDVVIVNFNGAKIIGDCLRSIYQNTVKPKAIIVYDNNSSDDSVAFIKSNFPGVTLIEGGKNIGFGRANNEAAKVATSEFILFLNNDVTLDRNCCASLLKNFTDRSIAVLNPLIFKGWEKRPKQPVYAFGAILDQYGFNYGQYALKSSLIDLNCFSGACFMARTKLFQNLEFEPKYFLYYEEPELSCRLLKAGYKIIATKEAFCYHLESYSSPQQDAHGVAFRQFYSIQNKYYMLGKHWPGRALPLTLCVNFFHLLFVLLFMLRHGEIKKTTLAIMAPVKFISGLLARKNTNTPDRDWFSKLGSANIKDYFSLGKKVFSSSKKG